MSVKMSPFFVPIYDVLFLYKGLGGLLAGMEIE